MMSQTNDSGGDDARWLQVAQILRDRPDRLGIDGMLERLRSTEPRPGRYLLVVTPLEARPPCLGHAETGECSDDLLWRGVDMVVSWARLACVSVHDLDEADFWAGADSYIAVDGHGFFTTFPRDEANDKPEKH